MRKEKFLIIGNCQMDKEGLEVQKSTQGHNRYEKADLNAIN